MSEKFIGETLRSGQAVVTGAGGGLGRALAIKLVQSGVQVAGLGRQQGSLEQTAALAGDGFRGHVCDVADSQAVAACFARIGAVSILINNAAVYPRRDILDETADSFMHSVQINLGGQVACSIAALETMTQTGIGRIVNVATFADIAPLPASAAYAVSKGAGRILTRALVADLGDRFPDIVINDWMPGMLATGMGIKDGLDPMVAAGWGGGLALWHDRGLNGAVFEMAQEVLAPRGLKTRLKHLLIPGTRPSPRCIRPL